MPCPNPCMLYPESCCVPAHVCSTHAELCCVPAHVCSTQSQAVFQPIYALPRVKLCSSPCMLYPESSCVSAHVCSCTPTYAAFQPMYAPVPRLMPRSSQCIPLHPEPCSSQCMPLYPDSYRAPAPVCPCTPTHAVFQPMYPGAHCLYMYGDAVTEAPSLNWKLGPSV